jgi:beta-glucanase (GH16 family)
LSYDFSQALITGTNTPVNADGGFSRIELFINGGTSKTGTYYIDDIEYPNYESANSLDVIYTNLVFADEFSAFGPIDTAAWFPQVEPEFPGVGWPNNEEQHYTNRTDNVYTSNGTLKITAKKESFTAYGLTKNYTSARLNSKFDFTYGRVDVRAKLPRGNGTWPAIWMLGTSFGNNWNARTKPWPDCGEIDIMEHWGNEPNYTHSSLHNPSSNGATVNTQRVINEDVFSSWHVYSMNWSPNQISFLIDGFLFYTYNPQIKDATTWPYDDPHFILLNVAMGGIYPIDPNFTSATMEIDYVRVFQNNISIGENTLETEVNVYPNPAADFVAISAEEKGEFILYDLLGKELLYQLIDRSGEIKITLPALAAGTYVWQYQAGGDSASGKLQIVNP